MIPANIGAKNYVYALPSIIGGLFYVLVLR